VHIVYPAVVSALLFSVGVYGVLARRNTILVLMSVELMLNAVNLNLVAFDVWLGDRLHSGQVLTLFVIVIAAAEVGLGLAIVLAVYRNRRTVDIDHLRDLAEPAALPPTPTSSRPQLAHTLADPTAPGQTAPDPTAPGQTEADQTESSGRTKPGQIEADQAETDQTGNSSSEERHARRGGTL
jgi:NADH-quinone oxidoreductase subunit K